MQADPEVIRAYLGSGDEIDPAEAAGHHTSETRDAVVTQFLSLLLNGISLGAIYALIALGFVIIFKASEVVSFTHGSLLLLGAYTIARLSDPLGFFRRPGRHRRHGARPR